MTMNQQKKEECTIQTFVESLKKAFNDKFPFKFITCVASFTYAWTMPKMFNGFDAPGVVKLFKEKTKEYNSYFDTHALLVSSNLTNLTKVD
jgi:hypothetical protein